VGTPVADFDLERAVAAELFDIVGFSISCETRLPHLKREMVRVRRQSRNPAIRVLVGGPCLLKDPGLSDRLGSDGWASDGLGAVKLASDLLGGAPA
jgi:methanogenic corrinoid protein MtbC1